MNRISLGTTIATLLLLTSSVFAQTDWEQEFIRTTTSDMTYQNYERGKALQDRGIKMAADYAAQITRYADLGYASNPQELLNTFNNNMQQIAQLQQQNKADQLEYLSNTLEGISNDINSGNAEGVLYSGLGYLGQLGEQAEAKREAERQKQLLIQRQRQQMSNFYWKAVDLNNEAIDGYFMNAAYAFSIKDERFNLAYVEHHRCFANFMENNFSYSNTNWTRNSCPAPEKTTTLENNLIAKDVQYINAAKRKYKLYQDTGVEHFRNAAIKFAGAAATEKPSAEYFLLMGEYAGTESPVVAYASLLSAQNLDPEVFTNDKQLLMEVEASLGNQIAMAIANNNLELIGEVIEAGLHQAVTIGDQPAFVKAIEYDQPDIVQLFLNDFAQGKSQEEINQRVNRTILLAAMKDAPNTINRFVELGFTVDFESNGYSPASVASKAGSENAFNAIMELSSDKSKYESLLSNSTVYIKSTLFDDFANRNFASVASQLESLDDAEKEKMLLELTDFLFFDIDILKAISQSESSIQLIKNNSGLSKKVENAFYYQLFYEAQSVVDFMSTGLIDISNNMRLSSSANSLQSTALRNAETSFQNVNESPQNYLNLNQSSEANFEALSLKQNMILQEAYTHFHVNGSKTSYVKGAAIWKEDLNNNNTLIGNAIPKLQSQSFMELTEVERLSVKYFLDQVLYKRYEYWNDDNTDRETYNEDIEDYGRYLLKHLNNVDYNSLVQVAIYKNDQPLLDYILNSTDFDWNTEVGGRPVFIDLAITHNFSFLDEVMASQNLNLNATDSGGNTFLHHLAEAYWNTRHLQGFEYSRPSTLLPKLYAKGFDKSLRKIKNNEGYVPWEVFKKGRGFMNYMGWAKWFKQECEEDLK